MNMKDLTQLINERHPSEMQMLHFIGIQMTFWANYQMRANTLCLMFS